MPTGSRAVVVTGLILAAVTVPAVMGSGPQGGTAMVTGMVVDGVSGQPIGGAVVHLGRSGRASDGFQARQISDSRGRFAFVGIPAGTALSVMAARPGYFDSNDTAAAVGSSQDPFALDEGEWLRDVRIVLWKPGAITGTVRDERGESVVGVQVYSVAVVHVAGREWLAAGPSDLTDDRGRYRITGLPRGRYLVAVPSVQVSVPAATTDAGLAGMSEAQFSELQGERADLAVPVLSLDSLMRVALGPYPVPPAPTAGRTFGYPLTFMPGTSAVDAATVVDLGRGEQRVTADVQLSPNETGTLGGQVTGPGEVGHLLVRLLAPGVETLGLGFEAAATYTSADGSFRFSNVPTGAYTLHIPVSLGQLRIETGPFQPAFRPPGLSTSRSFHEALQGTPSSLRLTTSDLGNAGIGPCGLGIQARRDNASALTARVPVAIGPGHSEVSVPLVPTASVTGQLMLADPTLVAAGRGVGIVADPADGDPTQGRRRARVETEGTGRFTLTGLEPGRYFLRSERDPWVVKSVTQGARARSDGAIEVSASGNIDDVVVTLTIRAATVRGTVQGTADRSADRRIVVFPANARQWVDFGTSPAFAEARTSQAGAYAVEGLPAGDYLITVLPEEVGEDWRHFDVFASMSARATRVSVDWGETRVVTLEDR